MEQGISTGPKEPNANELASLRTYLALDRTLLALVRTALTLMGFGFTLARIIHDAVKRGALTGFPSTTPQQMGLILLALGVLTLFGAAFEHVRLGKLLHLNSN
jgi:putative membrane protein